MGRPRPSLESGLTPGALICSISKDAAISLMTFEKIGVNIYCQIEHVFSDSDVGMPCGKPAVAKCADCGTAICSDCCTECCGESFCINSSVLGGHY
jgi:hypothetical protein